MLKILSTSHSAKRTFGIHGLVSFGADEVYWVLKCPQMVAVQKKELPEHSQAEDGAL